MENKQPKVSIIMSTFNRSEIVKETIDSILNQTYQNWEFFITDNGSSDDTSIVLEEYAAKDSRIKFLKNETNIYYGYHFKKWVELATGKYIARIDDDDIALPTRLEKQVKYMEENPEIALLGTYIAPFGDIEAKSWITEFDSDILSVAMHFYNPICHSSVMMRKGFLDEHKLNYNTDALYAEDYWLWKDILINGGKIANYPEELLKYRFHKKAASQVSNSSIIQDRVAENVREELLNRFYNNKKIVTQIREKIFKYPFTNNNKKQISNVLEQMKKYPNLISKEAVEKFEKRFCGIKSTMEIFFASDNNFVQHLCVAIASILKNSLPIEDFNFYILDGGIKEKNKKKIEELKKIKNFNIEFIKMDDSMFENCPITSDCSYISKQTYYRYLIPQIKPNLEKCFYFDCDIVADDSLNEFWNLDIKNNYVAGIEEMWQVAHTHYVNNGIKKAFNAGILLINIKKWNEDNICKKLFDNTQLLLSTNNLRWQDQDVLNYTFNNNSAFVLPKYNLQQTAFFDGQHSLYTDEEMHYSRLNPVIIHYSGIIKPWHKGCLHPLWKKYYSYLKFTPFKKAYIKFKIRHKIKPKVKNFIERIFSIRNRGIHKNICILGLKLKIKSKKLIERARFENLNNKFEQQIQKVQDLILSVDNKIEEQIKNIDSRLEYQQNKIENILYNHRNYKYEILKDKYNLIIREGTSDINVFYQVFVDENYNYSYAKEPNIILDIGANVGYTAIYYAKRFPKAQIYCLEPDLDNYNTLIKNIEKFPNIKACNGALYNKDIKLNIYDPGLGAWGLQISEIQNNTNKTVQAYSFKSLLKIWDLDNKIIDILKFDIEGSEKEIFETDTDFLNNVELMIIETHDRFKPGTSQAIFNVMKDKDFILNVKGEDLVFESKNYRTTNNLVEI